MFKKIIVIFSIQNGGHNNVYESQIIIMATKAFVLSYQRMICKFYFSRTRAVKSSTLNISTTKMHR